MFKLEEEIMLRGPIIKYPPRSHFINKYTHFDLLYPPSEFMSPLVLYIECGNPVISTPLLCSYIDERRYTQIKKTFASPRTGVLVCFSLGGTFHDWGRSKKSNWKNVYPPSKSFFFYLINMDMPWLVYRKRNNSCHPLKWLRIYKVAKYWKQLNLSQYCIYATTFHICLTTS